MGLGCVCKCIIFVLTLMHMHFIVETTNPTTSLRRTVNYLRTYTGIKQNSIISLDDLSDCNSKSPWCHLIWEELEENSHPLQFVSVPSPLHLQNITGWKFLEKVIAKSEEGSLIISTENVIRTNKLPELTFSNNAILILFPDKIISKANIQKFSIESELHYNPNIRFDSQIYVVGRSSRVSCQLFEIYRICENQGLSISHLVTFSADEKHMSFGEPDFIWKRRNNLMGCPLKVTYFENRPLIMVENVTNENSTLHKSRPNWGDRHITVGGVTLFGGNVELFLLLMRNLNFTAELVAAKGSTFGDFDRQTNTWNGIVGDVVNGNADISLIPIRIIKSRIDVLTFSSAVSFSDFGLYMSKPMHATSSWMTFWNVFYYDYWMLCVFSVICCCVTLYLGFEMYDTYIQGKRICSSTSQVARNIGSAFSIVALSFGAQDVNVGRSLSYSSPTSMKMLYFTVCLLGSLNYWSWTATLTSTLTYQKFELPIAKLEDLLTASDYQIVVLKGSSAESYFSDAKHSSVKSVAREIWSKKMEGNPAAFVLKSSEREHEILNNPKKVLFAPSDTAELTFPHYPCNISVAPAYYFFSSRGYAFPKNSPYVNVFNTRINHLIESGAIDAVSKRMRERKPLIKCEDSEEMALGFTNIFSAFGYSGIGVGFAICLCFLEYLHSLYSNNDNMRNHSLARPDKTIKFHEKSGDNQKQFLSEIANCMEAIDSEVLQRNDVLTQKLITILSKKLTSK